MVQHQFLLFVSKLEALPSFTQTFFIHRGMKKKQKFNLWRQKFMAGLNSRGVEIEEVGGH